MKKTNIVMFVVVLILSLFSGYVVGRVVKTREVLADKRLEEIKNLESKKGREEENSISVTKNRLNPSVKILVNKDAVGGHNLQINTINFYFTPANLGRTATQNTGYAEIFVNSVSIGRSYGNLFYVSEGHLQSGTNTVQVVLKSNNHANWLDKTGKKIETSVEIFR